MARLLTILSLVLVILLFPPATLALISNNAVPGDATYPIKRKLEDVIFAIASVNPVSKAWFSAARSDRRFQEVNTLIAQGKQANRTLQELVQETQSTADEISQVKDAGQKTQLEQQLKDSIKKYDQGLAELSKQRQNQPQPIAVVNPVNVTPSPNVAVTVAPPSTPTSRPVPGVTAMPTVLPTSTPTQLPPPPSSPVSDCNQITDSIERARCELEKLGDSLPSTVNSVAPQTEISPIPTPVSEKNEGRDEDNPRGKNLTPKDSTDKINEEKRH